LLGVLTGRVAQLLRNCDDACGYGVAGTIECAELTVNDNFARVGPMHAGQNPHQRRFAGSILAGPHSGSCVSVNEQDYNDGGQNEYPIGKLKARY
jgi:hypothetical protein